MTKIAHYADIQVKNREKPLYNVYRNTLKQIEFHIEQTEVEIAVLAGDFFEYDIPNDSERKLINNHLAHLLNIKTLKEIVLIAGNHDLTKDKKQIDTLIGFNPISIFNDMMNTLDKKKAEKIIYIKESKIYQSKVDEKINYIGYSLEDGCNPDLSLINPDKINICIFHAMIREYVDLRKLPVRKDILNSLFSLEQFPANSLILAGDIHENLKFDGLNDQIFYYPGSTTQHTHNEGSFYKISDDIEIKIGETKSIKIFSFDEQEFGTQDIELENPIIYNTISLDFRIPYPIIKGHLENLELTYGTLQTYIKVKSSNIFVQKEAEIFKTLSDKNVKDKVTIYFEYDKFVQNSISSENKIINEIIEEKKNSVTIQNPEQESTDLVINQDNIDELILNQEQLNKLFTSVLDEMLISTKSEFDDLTLDEIKIDIIGLFEKELNSTTALTTKRYKTIFKSIKTNCFMSLGENQVNLDIPGIIRILGTNGIGKTTLYNMIRWVITGFVYDGMSKNNVVKNNLIVFNKNLIDIDYVNVELFANINNLNISMIRTVVRKWKNNTTDEQKMSLNWKDYVGGIDRTFTLNLTTELGQVKTYTGEQAEKNVLIWFGQTIENILFLNQTKIELMLGLNSDKLNELILNFIGVDYLNKLESNLDIVKGDLLNISKPKKIREDIQNALIDNKIFLEKAEKTLEEKDIELIKTLEEENIAKTLVKKINTELLSIGNIPELMENKQQEINLIIEKIENFGDIEEKKKLIEFVEIKPKLNELLISNFEENIKYNDNSINDEIEIKTEFERELKILNEVKIPEIISNAKELINSDLKTLTEEFNQLIKDKKDKYNEILVIIDSKVQALTDKKIKTDEEINDYNTNIGVLTTEISILKIKFEDINKEIISGVCDKCKRPFGTKESWDIHLKELEENKIKITKEKSEKEKEKEIIDIEYTARKTLLSKITSAQLLLKYVRDSALQENNTLFEHPSLVKSENVQSIKPLIDEIELKINKNQKEQKEFNKKLSNLYYIEKIQYNKYEECKELIKENNDKIFWESIDYIIIDHKALNLKIKECQDRIDKYNSNIQDSKDLIKSLNDEHITALEKYQELFNANILANKEIQKYNDSIESFKNEKLNLEKDKIRLEKEYLLLENQTENYNSINLKLKTAEENETLITKNVNNIKSEQTQLKLNIVEFKNQKEKINIEYKDYLKYIKNNLIWKIYSKLIKNNFKEIVFEYYRNFLNNTLNYLLEDVNFKLFWNKDSELIHLSYKDGKCTFQPVQQSSGMETCFLGLSLIYTMHLLNVKNTVSHLFIDEISGTLNSGKELTYEAKNYKELLVILLSKFNDKSVFIIDHNIDNLFETTTYEVRPEESGSKYFQL